MSDAHAHEIVIIKRHGAGDYDDHHGGAWKIAFADFMTAMMALFLVLWLTSANEKTKAVIARYFNPAQLVDSTPQPPGLEDPKPGSPSLSPKPKTPPGPDIKKDGPPASVPRQEGTPTAEPRPETKIDAKTVKSGEAEMFKDPYAVLAELAAKSAAPPRNAQQAQTEGQHGGSGAVGIRSGDAYRDPFEPLVVTTNAPPDLAQAKPDPKRPLAAAPPPRAAKAEAEANPPAEPAAGGTSPAEVAGLKARITAAMTQNDVGASAGDPKIEVKQTAEGILIGLTDDAEFSMFGNGSARPAPKMVTLMEKIGRLLKAEKGQVVVRGFTDNRPYRSETYDNWQLSAARAHMAHYMLVRGGLEEARVEQIEGFADRRPKNPKDPGSPENRRIEILLRDPSQ